MPFADTEITVLDCTDLVVFKALFARTKDRADIEAMAASGTIEGARALGWVGRLVGPEHVSFVRLAEVLGTG